MKSKARTGFLVAILVASAALPSVLAADAVRVSVLSDDGARVVVEFEIGDYVSETVSIDGKDFERLWIPGEPVSKERGAPALPHVNRSVIVPGDAAMAVRILSVGYREILADVAPSKGLLLRTVDPEQIPYEFGDSYGTDEFYPGAVATLGEPYIMRDQRGIVVQVNPLQYNPVTRVLRVYTDITLEVAAAGPGEINVFGDERTGRKLVRAFDDIYGTHFLNYGHGRGQDYAPIDEQGDMLIIAHDPWIASLDSFVTHKASMGITATVVGVSTVGNDSVSIKSYIQNVYDTSDLAFVLLVGDAAQVATPTASGGASDPSYSKLAGSDAYPEIIVGRFSATTAAELDTQVQRTIDYESLPATGQDWFKRGTGIASAEGAGIGDEGQSDIQHMSEIRGWLLADGYTEVDQIYDPGAADSQVAAALNAGRGVVNYTGHGSATSWGTTGFNTADVNALANDDMLPFIVSVACNNGEFDHYGACFAEAWLRATNNGAPTGAIGMYGSSILQSWAPPMEAQDEFNLLLTDPERPYGSYGALCFAASSSMMDAYGSGGVDMFNTWNIFGDPSLRVVGGSAPTHGLGVSPAEGLSATGPAGGLCTPGSTVYTLRNHDEMPIDYEVACSEPWITVTNGAGTIPVGGATTVTVTLNDSAGNLDCGDYSDVVEFVNLTNHDGDTTRPVSMNVGAMTTLDLWTLDADPGWSPEGEWEFGTPTGNGGGHGVNPDPTSGATGGNVYGVNLDGDFSKTPGGPYYLTVGPLNLSGLHHLTLSFERWLNTVGPPEVLSTVDVSDDGVAWTNAWSGGALVADAAWSSQTFDVSSVADNRGAVYIRWGYQVQERVPHTGSGWNIDDVVLEGIPATARIDLNVEAAALSWTPLAGAIGYDVVRGDIATLSGSGGDFSIATDACLGDDLGATTLSLTDTPPSGAGYWFLVRGVTLSGPMTYQALAGVQVGMRDQEIDAAAGSCP